MKKKYLAHTFAELMISLVIVSVIAALVYPMLVRFNPDTNKPLFQAAYRTLTIVISEIVHANINGELPNANANDLCQKFCARTNVVSETVNVLDENNQIIGENQLTACNDVCNDTVITTTNGMRWHFNYLNPNYRISVDVNSANNNLASSHNDGRTYNFGTGVYTFADNQIKTNNDEYNHENLYNQDSFWIDIDNRGKIIDMSPAGWAHLEDSVDTLR